MELLPALWGRIQAVAGEGAGEEGARLVLVLTPHFEGTSLEMACGLRKALSRRAIGEQEGNLVNRLAARCLANLLKRGQARMVVEEVAPELASVLTDRNRPDARRVAANCLLEVREAEHDGLCRRACRSGRQLLS